MTWNRRYQVKSYLRSALWIIPFVAVPLEQVAWVLARTLDRPVRLEWARTRRHRCAGCIAADEGKQPVAPRFSMEPACYPASLLQQARTGQLLVLAERKYPAILTA
jgi:hypothetical protein